MTNEQFDALVNQLENYAQKHPGGYKLRLGLLAALGYVYILMILAVLLALIASLIGVIIYSHRINIYMIKFGIFLAIPVFIILQSLWVEIPPPQGLRLKREETPQLFSLLDNLTHSLQSPSFHQVLLTADFNASVVQIPRLGLLGWQQNYLLIGLPLMQALSPEQFRAVLAHELGHLSGNHSQFDGWIYRVRKTWVQMLQRLQESQQSGAVILFSSFFNWYAPFFNAYSFVLARADEYEADRCAAQLAGNQQIAEALLNSGIKHQFLEECFWPEIYKLRNQQPEPPQLLFTRLATALQTELKPEKTQLWMERALAVKTDSANTHPCLKDRLKALKYSFNQPPAPVQQTAAQMFLGKALKSGAAILEADWRANVNYKWQEQYHHAQKVRQQLQALEQKAASQSLTVDEAWNRALWTAEITDFPSSIPFVKAVLEMQPDHALGNYWLGQFLLEEEEDVKGIEYLEKGMTQNLEFVLPGCQLIYNFFQKQGQEEDANRYRQRAQEHYQQLLLANQERAGVKASDQFEPHELSAAAESNLRKQLTRYPEIKEVYLVKKVVKYFPEQPYYILGVRRNRSFWETDEQQKNQELLNQLATQLECPGQTWIVLLNREQKALEKALRKTALGPIYSV